MSRGERGRLAFGSRDFLEEAGERGDSKVDCCGEPVSGSASRVVEHFQACSKGGAGCAR